MSKIIGQHEAETQKELEAKRRAAKWSKIFGYVRLALFTLAIGGIALTAYFNQDKIVNVFSSKSSNGLTDLVGTNAVGDTTNAPAGGKISTSLNKASDNAAKRDSLINELSGGK